MCLISETSLETQTNRTQGVWVDPGRHSWKISEGGTGSIVRMLCFDDGGDFFIFTI